MVNPRGGPRRDRTEVFTKYVKKRQSLIVSCALACSSRLAIHFPLLPAVRVLLLFVTCHAAVTLPVLSPFLGTGAVRERKPNHGGRLSIRYWEDDGAGWWRGGKKSANGMAMRVRPAGGWVSASACVSFLCRKLTHHCQLPCHRRDE